MIDRYVLSNHKEVLEKYFNAAFKDEFVPRYNAAPTQKLPVITLDHLSRFQYFKWGFIANWANNKRMSPKLFNIDTETLLKKHEVRNKKIAAKLMKNNINTINVATAHIIWGRDFETNLQ